MNRFSIETAVGVFIIAGFLCFAYLSVKLGNISLFGDDSYPVIARFSSVSGLKEGASVEIAGVKVGKVSAIKLDGDDYEAILTLSIKKGVQLDEGSIASIRSSGIIGDRFVKIAPGGAEDYIEPGGEISDTEASINLEELVSKYMFEK
jgi:phospholipid/cholesterol/gamma-HCH transport system substrate-binding protein